MMLEDAVMLVDGSAKMGLEAYPELQLQCYCYLQMKQILKHRCEVQAKGAAY